MMLKNRNGMTLMEMMIGIALSVIVISIVISVQVKMSQQQSELMRKLGDSIDQNLAERILFKDLNGIDVAYNTVNLADDNGNNFFDFYPDITENILKIRPDRELNLSLDGKKAFYVLTQKTAAGSLLTYDPVWAYDVGKEPPDPNTPATLTFNATKGKSYMINGKDGGRPGFWADGTILYFDTPSRIRPVVNGVVDNTVPPRSPVYMGAVNFAAGDNLQNLTGTGTLFNLTQPATGAAITSLDNFFRKVPSVGGGQTIVRVRAVRLVMYYLDVDPKKTASDYNMKPANFYMAEYRNGQFVNPTLLADGVGRVLFRRDSVLKRMIYFKIEKAKLK